MLANGTPRSDSMTAAILSRASFAPTGNQALSVALQQVAQGGVPHAIAQPRGAVQERGCQKDGACCLRFH
ncbi:hypothetical protein EMIT0P253_270002 [Pseudomonas sp. IT-P253]